MGDLEHADGLDGGGERGLGAIARPRPGELATELSQLPQYAGPIVALSLAMIAESHARPFRPAGTGRPSPG